VRAILAALLLSTPVMAQEAPPCPPRGTPATRVILQDPEPRILQAVPAGQLRAEAGVPEGQAHLHHLGLTVSRVEWRSEITVRSQGLQSGPVCAVPFEIRLSLVHAEHSIRLAREIPRDGCLAREVLAHERRHVEVNRRTLREAAESLRGVARDWAARAEVRAADASAAATALQEDLSEAVEPILARLRSAREEAHARIDTPAEYARLGRVCLEDQRRLRGVLGGR
jgi:hypothetical protein